ncbi:MAG: ligase-associated DNA damage response DEXH box helicase [Rhodobacteraceae bacterium]|nr:ligase-associated DNA damage response DEXH box helicase [Paracoccaceae bacterium]
MNPLPPNFRNWFAARGWHIHPHQQQLLDRAAAPAALLIAPTGGGKTLAGFLPSLIDLSTAPKDGLHTLYVSPLKALAADIRRNLQTPIEALDLPVRVEDRTGDTSQTKRKRQRADPPHILLTTPESLAILLSYPDAPTIFAGLQRVVVDEIHALAESKRGDQLMLCLSRLQALCPDMRRVGLSATVEDPPALGRFLAPHPHPCEIITADPGPAPDITILHSDTPPPWAGAGAVYAVKDVLELVEGANTTLIFINTRAQAEIFFRALWTANDNALPIALHHGSLAREARDKVEAAMVAGSLRAVVCTGTLDLGIDWGDVDLVIQVGAPKNIKRLVQRIGRSNHRYNAPSRAVIVPANRFEVLEAQAALDAVRENTLDGEPRARGPRDVLCQHILLRACAGPFDAVALYQEITQAGPYSDLSRTDFEDCLEFCATGGYALRAYDRWQRLMLNPDGLWQLRDPRSAQSLRMNVGTIVDTETLNVRWRGRGGAPLGEIEEGFAATLSEGDTFLIGGQVVRYEGLREMTVQVTKGRKEPRIATFAGTKFATSTLLSTRVISLLNSGDWSALPEHTRSWLEMQQQVSMLPKLGRMLVESYWRDTRAYTCFYGFAGRNALQTLGLLVTRRMETAGLHPIGFVATDYALLIWGLDAVEDPAALLSPDDLRDGLEGWLANNAVMKRSFRNVATIAGLIVKNLPGKRKTGRQATFSSDILYDTLLKYDPDHLLLQITRAEAMGGLVDFGRIEEMLTRVQGRIDHVKAAHVTPLSAPMLLEVGKVPIYGAAVDRAAAIEAAELMREAGLG